MFFVVLNVRLKAKWNNMDRKNQTIAHRKDAAIAWFLICILCYNICLTTAGLFLGDDDLFVYALL